MKQSNLKKRLEARVNEWENIIKGDKVTEKKKRTTKPSGGVFEFTKPGSMRKKGN